MDTVIVVKWLHVLSSAVLFGTGIGTAYQMLMAWRSREPVIIARVAHQTVWADWLFTTPAGIVQPLTGFYLVRALGYDLMETWLVATYALYLLALACWLPVVGLQIRVRNLAGEAAAAGTLVPASCDSAMRTWFTLGWPAFGALVAVFYLMVARPSLW